MNTPTLLKTILLLIFSLTLLNCKKDSCDELNLQVNEAQLQEDIAKIDAYLATIQDDIEAQGYEIKEHPSGIRYVIKRKGNGDKPNRCDGIAATYQGKLISNGDTFDANPNITSFTLSNTITGWQIGLPLIGEGGRMTLYIPSVYAYGSSGRPNGGIPPNANLEFEILLFETR